MGVTCRVRCSIALTCVWSAMLCTSAFRIKKDHLGPSREERITPVMADLLSQASDEAYAASRRQLPNNTRFKNLPMGNMALTDDNISAHGGRASLPDAVLEAYKHSTISSKQILMALGGGIGASVGTTGSRTADVDLLRRVQCQDKGVLFIVGAIYFVALAFTASFTYRRVMNNSPVTYFCVPHTADGIMRGRSRSDFLQTFNQSPKATLQISGFEVVEHSTVDSIPWKDKHYRAAFAWSFDLTPWIAPHADLPAVDGEASQSAGMEVDDIRKLEEFLDHDDNDLAYVEISKHISWNGWEELATNIKHTIRQQGFTGIINVQPSKLETVRIHKNTSWANFVRAPTTFLLCCLSAFGLLVYLPYTWLRCKKVAVSSKHHVNVSIVEYWPFIASKLSVENMIPANLLTS